MNTKILAMTATLALAAPMGANAALVASYGTGSSGSVTGGTLTANTLWAYDTNNVSYYQGTTPTASNWIWGIDPNQDATIDFTFSFDLTGYDVSTISLEGMWGADNIGSVALNGNVLSELPTVIPGSMNFKTLTSYSTSESSYFNQGINNLVYSVTNVGGPGGFRAAGEIFADLGPSPAPASVPAPASLMLVLLGLAGFRARKRQST